MHFVCVSLYFWPWVFYQLPIKGMLGAVCGYMQHDFHLPIRHLQLRKAKFLGHRGPVAKSQAGFPLQFCSCYHFYFKRYNTFIV